MKRALVALALAATALPALGEEPEFCARLRDVVATAPENFRSLATDEVWTSAESYEARVTLPHFDACYVDQVQTRFWCLAQAKAPRASQTLAVAIAKEIVTCFPSATHQGAKREAEPGMLRIMARSTIGNGRWLDLVERRPQRADALGTVLLYVY